MFFFNALGDRSFLAVVLLSQEIANLMARTKAEENQGHQTVPKLAKALSALDVKRRKHPGSHRGVARFAVGALPGLMLSISETGARSWVFRTMVGTRRRNIGLGRYPTVTLTQVRERARDVCDMIRQGVDPVEAKTATRTSLAAQHRCGVTFDEAIERVLALTLDEFGNARHALAWTNSLRDSAGPNSASCWLPKSVSQRCSGLRNRPENREPRPQVDCAGGSKPCWRGARWRAHRIWRSAARGRGGAWIVSRRLVQHG